MVVAGWVTWVTGVAAAPRVIASWVAADFTSETAGGVTVCNLTQEK